MDWQWLAVAVSVAIAAGYIARQTWRTWAGRNASCSGCSCSDKSKVAGPTSRDTLISVSQLTARLRQR